MRADDRQYTLRGIPPALDRALRERAKREGKSLNQVAREALKRGLGLPEQQQISHDLDHLIGTWQEDPAFDEIIAAQDMVDPEAWP
ncbi:MAG TPA: antitoxin [Phycisphaerae bacterium]|jgi:plasmid stability protein|nr:ribbon-helix-helix protein, CopG family [Phycisphaerae bacterium]HOB76344.1 antitoxin [Phycisphaerae bacterium]HOJ55408.1 antitoxin [Phycisphaerae bacterium]HOL24956.1 antitoxin [Phycisphaerae bacterium]HPP20058.1 antitoxin [Phycisphaerae bacterium]